MIDVTPLQSALADRIAVVRALIDETHQPPPATNPIAREARGLVVVLLFAAYEELLKSLTRTLLEAASRLGVGNKRLRPGFRAFTLLDAVTSLRESGERKLFLNALPGFIETAARGGRVSSINTDGFPDDGSFMKRSQVELWAKTFDIGPASSVLTRTWNSIDAVVSDRNGIAHGRLTPQEVGRRYTEAEIRQLATDWADDWNDFVVHVGALAVLTSTVVDSVDGGEASDAEVVPV